MFDPITTTEETSMSHRGRGRPRIAGDRAASGRLSRAAEAIESRVSVDQLAQQRAQRYALLDEVGQGVELDDPVAVLAALGHLSIDEASAAAEIARMHGVLFGRASPKSTLGDVTGPPNEDPEDPEVVKRDKQLEARYERAWGVVGAVGGNAVRIVRYVCCGREFPAWVHLRDTLTVDRETGAITGNGKLNHAARAALERELPALRRALSACAAAGIVSAKKGRR